MKSANNKQKKYKDLVTISIVFLVAATVRIANVIFLSRNDPTFLHPFMDSKWHVEWALSVANGIWQPEPFFRAPLYPFFLGLLFKVFGFGLFLPRIVQSIIGSINVVLIYLLGKKVGGAKIGAISGAISAIYAPFIYFDSEFVIPVLFLPLCSLFILLIFYAKEKEIKSANSIPIWIISGFTAGLAAIAIPNILLFAPFAAVWIYFFGNTGRKKIIAVALWVCAFSLPVAGVTVYNALQGGGFVLVASQGGINFWTGNNEMADGKTAMAPADLGPRTAAVFKYVDNVRSNAEAVAELKLGRKLNAAEISGFWFAESFRFIKDSPIKWIGLNIKKSYFSINGYELPSNREIYRVRSWSPILKYLLYERPLAFPFGLLFPVAAAGIFLSIGNKKIDRDASLLLLSHAAIYASTVVAFFVTARHRLPIVPPLIPFAAFALNEAFEGYKTFRNKNFNKKELRKPAIAASILLAFLFISNSHFFEIDKFPRSEHYLNIGYSYSELGKYEEALAEFKAAAEDDPRSATARFNIGAVYLLMGKKREAYDAFMKTLEIDPNHEEAWVHLGNVYFESNQFDDAEKMYIKALSLNDKNPLAHYNLALLYKTAGDGENYIKQLLKANEADPNFLEANIAIAQILVNAGKNEEAKPYIDAARRVAPQDKRLLFFREKEK